MSLYLQTFLSSLFQKQSQIANMWQQVKVSFSIFDILKRTRWQTSHQCEGRKIYEMSTARFVDEIINGVSKIDTPSHTSNCRSAGRFYIIQTQSRRCLPGNEQQIHELCRFLLARRRISVSKADDRVERRSEFCHRLSAMRTSDPSM